MTWAMPEWLWALVLVPPFWWLASHRIARRGGQGSGGARARWLWVDGRRVRPAAASGGGRRLGAWASAGLALGIVALAQPQWGEGEVVRFDQGREVLIALDLSRSMLAEDVPPSRLERARLLIESTLDELRGERVGLLLFAGTAFLQSPLSADHEVLRELLPVLEPGYLPQGGTDFAAMIDTALEAFSQTGAADRFLVILSDGESPNFEPEAVQALVDAGVRVVALGIGTSEGALIPDGRGGIVKDDRGAAVLSRLERPVLEGLARTTRGAYADAASWLDLAALVERTVAEGREGQFVEERERSRIHRYQWVLAPALLLLLASHLFEVPAAPRTRRLHGHGHRGLEAGAPLRAGLASLVLGVVLVATAGRTGATPPPVEPQADPIVSLVERLSTHEVVSAAEWAELARTTAETGFDRRAQGAPLAPGAIGDALAAVDVGRALDPAAADWAGIRAALQELQRPQPQPPSSDAPQSGQPGEEGEPGEQGGGGESSESQPGQEEQGEQPQDAGAQPGASGDGQGATQGAAGSTGDPEQGSPDDRGGEPEDSASAGQPGEDDASQAARESPPGDPTPVADASAGFGELGEEREGRASSPERDAPPAGDDAAEEQTPPPSRMVGGTRSENEGLLQERPDLAATVGRMERVREADAPALLFDRMNRAEGRHDERDAGGGQDW